MKNNKNFLIIAYVVVFLLAAASVFSLVIDQKNKSPIIAASYAEITVFGGVNTKSVTNNSVLFEELEKGIKTVFEKADKGVTKDIKYVCNDLMVKDWKDICVRDACSWVEITLLNAKYKKVFFVIDKNSTASLLIHCALDSGTYDHGALELYDADKEGLLGLIACL